MKKSHNKFETIIHGIFLILGLITVGFVLLITVYLVIAGIPAIREIGLFKFLFGKKWASTASTPSYGILPFILTSIYGTAGAIIIGVPIGFLTAVYLAKVANKKMKAVVEMAVMMVSGNVANMPKLFGSVRFLTTAVASEMSYSSGLQKQALFSIALVLFLFIMLINAVLNSLLKKEKE